MHLQVRPDQYIFPPRPENAIPRSETELFKALGWVAQYKYNDSRCVIKVLPSGEIELWNRHAEKFRDYTAPDWLINELMAFRARFGEQKGVDMFDGGLLDRKHAAIKDTIVIWDVLVLNNEHLIGTTYGERYDMLKAKAEQDQWYYDNRGTPVPFGYKFSEHIFMPQNWVPNEWDAAWDTIEAVNRPYTVGKPGDANYNCRPVIEGIVMKELTGRLELGFREKNNGAWQTRSRVVTGRHRY